MFNNDISTFGPIKKLIVLVFGKRQVDYKEGYKIVFYIYKDQYYIMEVEEY